MANRLRILPAVEADLIKAIDWYDRASSIRGVKFRQAVKKRFAEIRVSPNSFAIDGNARFAKVEGFPYIIIFESLSDGALIVGVVHASSDPNSWRDRLSSS